MRLRGAHANLLEAQHLQPAKTTRPIPAKRSAVGAPEPSLGSDATYLPERRGFLYLVASIDWQTHKVLP